MTKCTPNSSSYNFFEFIFYHFERSDPTSFTLKEFPNQVLEQALASM